MKVHTINAIINDVPLTFCYSILSESISVFYQGKEYTGAFRKDLGHRPSTTAKLILRRALNR